MQFEVPLLDSHKTHDRLQAPYWSGYLSENFKKHGKITEIETDIGSFKFISASANTILESKTSDTELNTLAKWVQSGNYKRNMYGQMSPYSSSEVLMWICFPDCRWGVSISIYLAHHSTSLLNDLKTPDGSFYDILVQTGQDYKYRIYADTVLEIQSSWSDQWKKSRQAWKRQERKNGGLKASQAQKKIDDAIELKEARESAKEHLENLITLLSDQITAIDENTVAVQKVGEIFNATNELTSRHYRLKKALKIQ